MKLSMTALCATLFLSAGIVSAATNDITALLQKGLFEEEANHNLEAAMRQYQAAIDGFDQDRQLAATAVFRLGECYRKLGKTNEAGLQYGRVVREFPDQTNLVKLSSDYLGGAKTEIWGEQGLSANEVQMLREQAGAAGRPGSTFEQNLRAIIRNAAGGTEARSQQLQNAYDDLKLKWTLADRELAAITNLSKQDQEKYFTTVKPDDVLLGIQAEHRQLVAKRTETAIVIALEDQLNERVIQRVESLVWSLKEEAQLLHDQVDALRQLLDQSAQGVAANALPGGSAPSNPSISTEDEDVRKIREMIRNSPDLINAPNDGYTPLQHSVLNGNVAAAELLLANGANVNETGSLDQAPLSMAADTGNKGMIELLLGKGASVNVADKNKEARTPLFHAVAKGFKTAAEVLIAHQADVNVHAGGDATPLYLAAASGFPALVELLLANRAEVNATNATGNSPLFIAVQDNRPEVVQLLLSNKAEVNFTNSEGDTPLFGARNNYQTNVAQLLLAGKAEVNHRDKSGFTPLVFAVRANQTELVRLLLRNQADVNAATESGLTPLLFATDTSSIDINLVKSLLESGADTQAHLKEGGRAWDNFLVPGSHALDLAIIFGRTDEIELLLASHADPNARHNTLTPLIVIASIGDPKEPKYADELKILLEHGADPDLADRDGRTALSHAVAKGDPNLVQLLLEHHADPNKPDNQGLPPLAYMPKPENSPPGINTERKMAEANTYMKIKALLLKAGANEDFERVARIFIAQKGTGSIGQQVFYKGTNSVNHYTLFELIAEAYQSQGRGAVPFPDFAHIVINRLNGSGPKEEISVNADEIIASGDCSKDVPLQWGDVVQILQKDHPISQLWQGFQPNGTVPSALQKCLQRHVEIIVKGQTNTLALVPHIAHSYYLGGEYGSVVGDTLYTFSLYGVVHRSNLLLLSSDLSRVKVTRDGMATEYNIETQNPSDLWLRDGDVIEIPERDPNGTAVK